MFDGGLSSCHNKCNIAQEKTLISDKTVDLLTRLRGLCESLAEMAINEDDESKVLSAAVRLDVLTDIMDDLMAANAMEQKALMAKDCGDACKGMVEAVEAMRDNMNKDEGTVN